MKLIFSLSNDDVKLFLISFGEMAYLSRGRGVIRTQLNISDAAFLQK